MDLNGNPLENSGVAIPEPPAGKDNKPKKLPGFIYLIFALMVVGGIFIAKFSLDALARKATRQPQTKPKASLSAPSPTKAVEPAAQTVKSPQIPPPAAPTTKKILPAPALTLSGIFYDDRQPCALIDNKIVKEGDVVAGAKVLKILSNEVKLEFEGETFELTTR